MSTTHFINKTGSNTKLLTIFNIKVNNTTLNINQNNIKIQQIPLHIFLRIFNTIISHPPFPNLPSSTFLPNPYLIPKVRLKIIFLTIWENLQKRPTFKHP